MFNKSKDEAYKATIEQLKYDLNIQHLISRLSGLENPLVGEVYYDKRWYEFNNEQLIDEVDNKVKLRLFDGLVTIWIDKKYIIFYNYKDTIKFQNKKKEIERLKEIK